MAFETKTVYIDTAKFPVTKIPATGGTVPTAASALGTPDISEDLEFEILASRSVDTTHAAGYNDLFNTELKADIDTYIEANTGLGIDALTRNVSYNARVKDVFYGNGTDMYLTATLLNYKITIELEVHISAL